jgi:hypothetical protein
MGLSPPWSVRKNGMRAQIDHGKATAARILVVFTYHQHRVIDAVHTGSRAAERGGLPKASKDRDGKRLR